MTYIKSLIVANEDCWLKDSSDDTDSSDVTECLPCNQHVSPLSQTLQERNTPHKVEVQTQSNERYRYLKHQVMYVLLLKLLIDLVRVGSLYSRSDQYWFLHFLFDKSICIQPSCNNVAPRSRYRLMKRPYSTHLSYMKRFLLDFKTFWTSAWLRFFAKDFSWTQNFTKGFVSTQNLDWT